MQQQRRRRLSAPDVLPRRDAALLGGGAAGGGGALAPKPSAALQPLRNAQGPHGRANADTAAAVRRGVGLSALRSEFSSVVPKLAHSSLHVSAVSRPGHWGRFGR